MGLYDELVAAGCEVENHYSDLYVKATEESVEIVAAWQKANPELTGGRYFSSQIDGLIWIDVPFMYAPFWRDRGMTA